VTASFRFRGKDYPISISGLSLLDLGVSGVSVTGKVYYLNKLADFSGNYFATQATIAVAGGVQLSSEQSGTQLTLGASWGEV